MQPASGAEPAAAPMQVPGRTVCRQSKFCPLLSPPACSQYAEGKWGGLRQYMVHIGFGKAEQERLCRGLTAAEGW